MAPDQGAPRLHGGRARHQAKARGAALLQHPSVPAAILAFAQQRDGCDPALTTFRLDTTYFRRTWPVREMSRRVDGFFKPEWIFDVRLKTICILALALLIAGCGGRKTEELLGSAVMSTPVT